MKKLLLIVLAVFLQAGSMFAQSIYDSLIVFTMELDRRTNEAMPVIRGR